MDSADLLQSLYPSSSPLQPTRLLNKKRNKRQEDRLPKILMIFGFSQRLKRGNLNIWTITVHCNENTQSPSSKGGVDVRENGSGGELPVEVFRLEWQHCDWLRTLHQKPRWVFHFTVHYPPCLCVFVSCGCANANLERWPDVFLLCRMSVIIV